jgi:prepilin-type N-terminal cleavage/methylation domain-containing protein
MTNNAGLTLIELLVAAAILTVILGLVASGIQSGGSVVTQVVSESELLEDTRVAAQLIADSAAKAVYVYPPGATLSLNSAGSWTVQNPRTNKNVWTIGTDPMFAFIEGAQRSDTACVGTDSAGKKKLNDGACLSFVAYYPVKRATVVKQENYKYLEEKQNETSWMLFEYRKTLELTELNADTPLPMSSATGLRDGQGRILADYLVPNTGFQITSQICHTRITPSQVATEGSSVCTDFKKSYDPFYLKTMSSAAFSLQTKVSKGRVTVETPVMTFAVVPRNLY